MSGMSVHVLADRCVGSGQCLMLAPEVFDLGDDGTAIVLREQVDAAQAEDVASAAHLCTAQAIVLRTDGPAKER